MSGHGVSAVFIGTETRLPLWLSAETDTDRRLIARIIQALADEANSRLAEGDWSGVAPVIATGGNLMRFQSYWRDRQEEAEDEAV